MHYLSSATPQSPLERLRAEFDLAATSHDAWRTTTVDPKGGRAFGGTVLAQAIAAAWRTVPADFGTTAVSIDFLQPADGGTARDYCVKTLHDGKSTATRRVSAVQHDQLVAAATVRFSSLARAAGIDVDDVTHPDHLAANGMPHPARAIPHGAFDIRHQDVIEDGTFVRRLWFRTTSRLPAEDPIHEYAVALMSDLYFFEPILAAHGYRANDRKARYATLGHCMWFHHRPRADRWLLIESRPAFTSRSGGLVCGEIRTAGNLLVATVIQDARIKIPTELPD